MKKRRMSFASGKDSNSSNVESVDVYYSDDEDEIGFSEGEPDLKNAVATFNFAPSSEKDNGISSSNEAIPKEPGGEIVTELKTAKAGLNGLTPPIDGENFSVKRGYQFRPSTLRKLNELKAKHPDLDVYLNTILDAAILHYYNYIVKEGGNF